MFRRAHCGGEMFGQLTTGTRRLAFALGALACAAVAAALVAVLAGAAPAGTPRLVVSLTFDDGYANQSTNAGPILADRKSTRLNSSHMSISYAVFCLKKKS